MRYGNYLSLLLAICVTSFVSAQSQSLKLFNDQEIRRVDQSNLTTGLIRSAMLTSEVAVNSLTEQNRINLNLFPDVNLEVVLEPKAHRHLVDVDLFYGRTQQGTLVHPEHYRDVIITINRVNQKMVVVVMSEQGLYQVLPTNTAGEYRVAEYDPAEVHIGGCSLPGNSFAESASNPVEQIAGCNEQDSNGDFVIDYLTGFSHEAVQDVGDINAYSVAQIETVNQGLANSLVSGVYLRLVDVAVRDGHAGIVSSWIGDGFDLFEDDLIAVGADMIATYQSPKADVSNAGGWASVPGRSSVNQAGSPTVFRHECGHNAGSAHCPGDGGVAAYSAGWNNGSVNTHMCGNNINYFSNPDINVSGAPIGDAATADNARLWRERGSLMASYSQHVIPYDAGDLGTDNCNGSIPDGVYYVQNNASGLYLQPDNNGNTGSKLFQSATNASTLEQWEFRQLTGNTYNIYNRSSNRVVDVFGSTNNSGPNVGLWTTQNSSNQHWTVEATGNGTYTLTSNRSGKCLYVSPSMMNAGDEVWQEVCDGTVNAEWNIVAVPNNPSLLTIDLATSSASCNGEASGMITATVNNASGSETYLWSDGSVTSTISNTTAGQYALTVTDGGVAYYKNGSINSNAPLIPEITITDARTSTGGMIEVTNVQNATGALSFAWSDGGPNSATRINLAEGDYTVTITDANGCQDVREVRLQFSPDDDNYAIQHLASGLFLSTLNEENSNTTPVVLGECPNDNYNWFVYRNGSNGTVFRFRHVNSNRGLTVFGRNNIGEGYYIGNDANISTHRHILHRISGNTYELQSQSTGYYAHPEAMEVNSEIVMGEADGTTDYQFVLVPIPDNCDPVAGTACDDGDLTTEGDEVTILCDCCGSFNAALPVELLDFYGQVESSFNRLSWSTAQELNNRGFYVQRSTDGRIYTDLGFVEGMGNTSTTSKYTFLDEAPLPGQVFYRLRQLDTDGTETFSRIVDLTRQPDKVDSWRVFPNPASSNLSVSIVGNPNQFLQLELIDGNGRKLKGIPLRLDAGGKASMRLPTLRPGVYLLRDQLSGAVERLIIRQ